ncbi:hypothetical protein, partial [Burkholderia pseudomallei]|uniref:hypothetical protein n=1 Tax=Burkholderia pseudomallei TaxID=28450 RepID=UPI001C4D1E17
EGSARVARGHQSWLPAEAACATHLKASSYLNGCAWNGPDFRRCLKSVCGGKEKGLALSCKPLNFLVGRE